jgi:hypothetical protein
MNNYYDYFIICKGADNNESFNGISALSNTCISTHEELTGNARITSVGVYCGTV